MQKIDYKKDKIPFTQVANAALYDTRISFKAKGLYTYLYSKPDGWDFSSERIAHESLENRDAIRSALMELENYGYLIRHKLPNGRMAYQVKFPPMTENPSQGQEPMTENTTVGKYHSGKTRRVSNTDGISNKEDISNIAPETGAGSPQKKSKVLFTTLGADILKEFQDKVDPKNGTYYNNKTQRAAADFLIAEYSFEKVSKVISILQKTNKIPYYPKIYSPADLKEKWQALRDAIETKKTELIGKEPKFII